MSKLLASTCCAALLAFSPAVLAVDIENQDDADYEVSVMIGENAPTTFVLKAGEIKTNVCNGEPCVMELEGSSWEGEADEKLVVRDKKLQLSPEG